MWSVKQFKMVVLLYQLMAVKIERLRSKVMIQQILVSTSIVRLGTSSRLLWYQFLAHIIPLYISVHYLRLTRLSRDIRLVPRPRYSIDPYWFYNVSGDDTGAVPEVDIDTGSVMQQLGEFLRFHTLRSTYGAAGNAGNIHVDQPNRLSTVWGSTLLQKSPTPPLRR